MLQLYYHCVTTIQLCYKYYRLCYDTTNVLRLEDYVTTLLQLGHTQLTYSSVTTLCHNYTTTLQQCYNPRSQLGYNDVTTSHVGQQILHTTTIITKGGNCHHIV